MPIWRATLHSDLPPQEVERRLDALVLAPTNPLFKGTVRSGSFKLTRILRHQINFFLPVIRGAIVPSAVGTEVKLLIHISPLAGTWLILWLAFFGDTFVGSRADQFMSFGVSVFGLILVMVGFFPEAFKAKRLLQGAIEAAA